MWHFLDFSVLGLNVEKNFFTFVEKLGFGLQKNNDKDEVMQIARRNSTAEFHST